MVLDLERLAETIDNLGAHGLRQSIKLLANVTLRSREALELLRVDEVREARQLLHEALQVEATLVDELDILVADGFLGRQLRERNTRPARLQFFAQLVELVVAAITFPLALIVHTLALVHNMAAAVLRVRAREALLIDSLDEIVLLVEHIGINVFFLSSGTFFLGSFRGFHFLDLFVLISHDC